MSGVPFWPSQRTQPEGMSSMASGQNMIDLGGIKSIGLRTAAPRTV
ncbi:hypothetical protein [Marinobacter sp. BGYM27]|nr:hypothetical protein [Marinobacter sp. BGYM27]MDG5498977.1 hypothetical protein [Marinobacter sp. BGYM27]